MADPLTAALSVEGVPFAIRDSEPGDIAYVARTWRRTYRPIAKFNNREVYDKGQNALIDKLIADGRLVIACDPEMPSVIIGWACAKGHLLHYAFVRDGFQGKGVARQLIKVAIGCYPSRIEVTHKFTRGVARFVYNPYPLMVAIEHS